MGWYFLDECRTRAQLVETIKREEVRDSMMEILADRVVGSNLWVVIKRGEGEGERRFVACFMLDKARDPGGWGYKPLDESMGPTEVNCPLAFLDLASPASDIGAYAPAWRERVRAYHRERGAQLAR